MPRSPKISRRSKAASLKARALSSRLGVLESAYCSGRLVRYWGPERAQQNHLKTQGKEARTRSLRNPLHEDSQVETTKTSGLSSNYHPRGERFSAGSNPQNKQHLPSVG